MDEQISQFVSITGSSPEKAKFYVESAKGDVDEAVSTYFEAEGVQDDGEEEEDEDVAQTVKPVPSSSSGPQTLSGAPAPALPEGWAKSGREGGASASTRSSAPNSGAARFATLSDYRSEGPPGRAGDEDDDDDGRDPVNFFTGGERSGLSVQNPDHGRRRGAPNVVQDILQRAREMAQQRADGGGAEDDDDDDWDDEAGAGAKPAKQSTTSKSFAGQGRSLVDDEAGTSSQGGQVEAGPTSGAAPSSSVPGAFELAGEGAVQSSSEAPREEIANRRIIFWQDGFSLEDGPLCRYDDPQHAQTLAMINQGAAPLSFLNVRFGQRVNLTVEQRHENYSPPPPPPMKPFGGSGNRLGSPAPGGGVTGTTSVRTTNASPALVPASNPASVPSSVFEVNASQPTTQLQIRLADGQRVVGRFNHTHTVGDVRQYINASHPGMVDRSYVLQTSFPPKPITDESQSLKDANLINAVVIQKWT